MYTLFLFYSITNDILKLVCKIIKIFFLDLKNKSSHQYNMFRGSFNNFFHYVLKL